MSLPAIDSLIPHRPPMQLIDAVLGADSTRLQARAQLLPGTQFYNPQGVPACIGLEYLGQAAAAFFSLQALQMAASSETNTTEPPRAGMLIASRAYRCESGFFPADHELLIEVEATSSPNPEGGGLVKFSGHIHVLALNKLQVPDSASSLAAGACMLHKDSVAGSAFAAGDLSVYLPPQPPAPQPLDSSLT